MLEDLPSHKEIARLTDRLLREADAYGCRPTPVADILAAAKLVEAPQTFLSASSIAHAPAHLRGILSRMSGKGHAVLDRRTREVHVNPATDLAGQQAFKRLHETSDDLFTWQHVDDGHTASPMISGPCRRRLGSSSSGRRTRGRPSCCSSATDSQRSRLTTRSAAAP